MEDQKCWIFSENVGRGIYHPFILTKNNQKKNIYIPAAILVASCIQS